jgi:murein DD-endopeptidase MepM/ murein hydrolase activator NlpD
MEAAMRQALVVLIGGLSACATGQPARADLTYILPYPAGASHVVVQGFIGRYGHTDAVAFAYDFTADIGSPVTAARGGGVVHVVESNADSPPRQPQPGRENVVVVDHGDDTFGRYYHLTQNGADVSVGDHVAQGQAIGRSGNSGSSFLPHLHFDVTRGCHEWGCQTVEFSFADVTDDPLVERQSYAR